MITHYPELDPLTLKPIPERDPSIPTSANATKSGYLADCKPGDIVFFALGGGMYGSGFYVGERKGETVSCQGIEYNFVSDYSVHSRVRILPKEDAA